MATLGVTFAGAAIGLSGGSKDKKPSPPINASSADEEKFIKEFIQQTNMDQLKEKH
ncbi:MAG: hypothetical protein MMC23_006242 [Stictis urceolatum]|nr:hypothetical protein [Stictis urceolata]